MNVVRRATAATAALLALLSPAAVPASPAAAQAARRSAASPDAGLALPPPTGHSLVGATTLDLLDRRRADPWRPGVRRELMVTVWYPAGTRTRRLLAYTTPEVSAGVLGSMGVARSSWPGVLSAVRTHSYVDAPPAGSPGRRPLVLLSPGFGMPRSSLTALGEDLASRGYVVAGVDHTYEAAGVQFPDGRFAGCVPCSSTDPERFGKVIRGRREDLSFVLDRLTGSRPAWSGAGIIDTSRIGMAGHSIGGAAALATMQTDRRVRAGLDLDGTLLPPRREVRRPFLLVGSDVHGMPGTDGSWEASWAELAGWKKWLRLAGAGHLSFTDWGLLAEGLGVRRRLPPDSAEEQYGRIGSARGVQITRAYVAAFFDAKLRGERVSLLTGPSRAYPEITFKVPR